MSALHRTTSASFIDASQPAEEYRILTQEESVLMKTESTLLKQIYTVAFTIVYCNEEWPLLDAQELVSLNKNSEEIEKTYFFPDDIHTSDREIKKSCLLKGVLFGFSNSGQLYAWNYENGEFLRHFVLKDERVCELWIKEERLYIKTESEKLNSNQISYKKLDFEPK